MPQDLIEEISDHLDTMPTLRDHDDDKENWWIRAIELHQQALDEGYVMEGDPDDEWE